MPGLQLREVHGKSGYEVTLQGMTSDQVLVLVDGLPITASTGSTVDLGQYLLSAVDRVEVVKGAASAHHRWLGHVARGVRGIGRDDRAVLRRTEAGQAGTAGLA